MGYTTKATKPSSAYANWGTSQTFAVNAIVQNGTAIGTTGYKPNTYRCIQAGTSSSSGSGPSGTTVGAQITDGTVIWTYAGPGYVVIAKDDNTDPSHHTSPPTYSEAPPYNGAYVVYVNQTPPFTYAPIKTPQHLIIPNTSDSMLIDGNTPSPPIPGAPLWAKYSVLYP